MINFWRAVNRRAVRYIKDGSKSLAIGIVVTSSWVPHCLAKEVKIEWKPLEKAVSYEIQIKHRHKLVLKANTDRPYWKGDLEPDDYNYQIKGIDRRKRFGHVTSIKNLRVLPPPPAQLAVQEEGDSPKPISTSTKAAIQIFEKGYLAFSEMLSPYTYRITSPSRNVSGETQSTAIVSRASGEYWLNEDWGLGGAINLSSFSIMGQDIAQPSFEFFGKYRLEMPENSNWGIFPKLGIEGRDFSYVLPAGAYDLTNLSVKHYIVMGPSVGVDIRKKVSDCLSVGAKLSYFLPIYLFEHSDQIMGSPAYRNLSFGIQGLYWLSPNWGLGAGGYFELRSLSFAPSGSTKASEEQVFMDGSYFFVSLVYRFSR